MDQIKVILLGVIVLLLAILIFQYLQVENLTEADMSKYIKNEDSYYWYLPKKTYDSQPGVKSHYVDYNVY